MQEELSEQPLYHVLDSLCNTLHSVTPSHAQFRSALLHAGYKVSSTHAHESGIKTNAPPSGNFFSCFKKISCKNSISFRNTTFQMSFKEIVFIMVASFECKHDIFFHTGINFGPFFLQTRRHGISQHRHRTDTLHLLFKIMKK